MNWNKLYTLGRYSAALIMIILGCIGFMTGTISGIRGGGVMIVLGILFMILGPSKANKNGYHF